MRRFRDGDNAVLQLPAQRDLRRRFLVFSAISLKPHLRV